MKKELFIYKGLIAAIAIIGAVTLQSCLDDDNDYRYIMDPNALVTVKLNADKTFYLQLDEKTTLLPVNVSTSPFGEKEVRALVNYDKVDQASGIYNEAVHINWIDSILTKPIAPDLGEENDAVYGTDPVEIIIKDWVTIAEDGYLTLRFRTIWGGYQKPHFINLLPGNNPENPYELEFRHNAYGDVDGYNDDALVAFNLKSLPDTDGKTVKLKLKWQSFSGEKSAEFDYCTQKTVMPQNESITSIKSNKGIR